jgi:hypothetical protein
VGLLLQPTVAREVAGKTILTTQQVQGLMHDDRTRPVFGPEAARSFLVVDHARLLPIAPGIVLIRAPGHTPGSQIVHVHLASGREIMLIGDIVWRLIGLALRHQKPDSVSKMLGWERHPHACPRRHVARWLRSDEPLRATPPAHLLRRMLHADPRRVGVANRRVRSRCHASA